MLPDEPTPETIVERCRQVMAHAWMVRTFVKHSEESEDFPDLMLVVRTVFDTSRALETRLGDPPGYFKMLDKKIAKLRQAADRFRTDAEQASTHMNFKQAVLSLDACVGELDRLLEAGKRTLQQRSPT